MPSISDQSALRERLQHIEDRLVRDHKQQVIVLAARGVFFWSLSGKIDVPLEEVEMPELEAIENMLIALGWSDLLVSTAHGYFGWEPYARHDEVEVKRAHRRR